MSVKGAHWVYAALVASCSFFLFGCPKEFDENHRIGVIPLLHSICCYVTSSEWLVSTDLIIFFGRENPLLTATIILDVQVFCFCKQTSRTLLVVIPPYPTPMTPLPNPPVCCTTLGMWRSHRYGWSLWDFEWCESKSLIYHEHYQCDYQSPTVKIDGTSWAGNSSYLSTLTPHYLRTNPHTSGSTSWMEWESVQTLWILPL